MPDTREAPIDRATGTSPPRNSAADEILRPQPGKGQIDHAALSREIIARYPKILAALAK